MVFKSIFKIFSSRLPSALASVVLASVWCTQSSAWRTAAGREVDMVVETEAGLIPVEIKLSATPRPGMAAGIESFRSDYGKRVGPCFVVHTGGMRFPLAPGVTAIPYEIW